MPSAGGIYPELILNWPYRLLSKPHAITIKIRKLTLITYNIFDKQLPNQIYLYILLLHNILISEAKLFINHKRCPKCHTKLARTDWICSHCNNQNLTNWSLTLPMWGIAIFTIIMAILFMINNFCSTSMFRPFANSYGVMC